MDKELARERRVRKVCKGQHENHNGTKRWKCSTLTVPSKSCEGVADARLQLQQAGVVFSVMNITLNQQHAAARYAHSRSVCSAAASYTATNAARLSALVFALASRWAAF